jgi:mono/diheme cytochrome c family protein
MEGGDARTIPEHTVSRDSAPRPAPPEISTALLERGRERYEIYCSPCHGRVGDGQGMIVQRGFPPPPTFHQPRLREAPAEHYYEVITNGLGVMYPYAARVAPADRWAIIAYIRALQRSQNATLADASPEGHAALHGEKAP